MDNIFLDTDVAFDIISKRVPHYIHSIQILQLAADGKVKLFILESSIANLFYLAFDIYKIKDAAIKLSDFIAACDLLVAGKQNILRALQSAFKDKEDAIQYYTALHFNIKYFITGNIKDYKYGDGDISIFKPVQFLNFYEMEHKNF
jgi:predicted nucleic acid-binding protein